MDNTEQLKFEAMGDLDIQISKIKHDALGGTKELKRFDKTWCTWGYQGAQEILLKTWTLGVTKVCKEFLLIT